MSLRVYNTLGRTLEEFVPLQPGRVGMYVCGVTVYDLCHVGHARSAIVFDVIRRYLTSRGYRVTYVRNFTDVDDKIIRRAQEEGVESAVIAERYIAAFHQDLGALGVVPAPAEPGLTYREPRATAHIAQMVGLIERLLASGHAYPVDGDVYFEIRRFPPYGRLSGKDLEALLAGARVEVDERKRDPRDFALWKAAKPGEPAWPSPWGPGRPGWHIECSAMAMEYLGQALDIHGGGEDLIFPHHESEIAQAEAVTGHRFARYWLHNAFVNIGTEKMSKSLGNTLLVRELLKRHSADALRLWLLGTHYRSPVEFAEERLHEAGRALERLTRLRHDARRWSPAGAAAALPASLAGHRARLEAAMDDDFNTPQALGVLFELARALGELRERADQDPAVREAFVAGVQELVALGRGVLGLFETGGEQSGPPPEVERLVRERDQARRGRDWARADALRQAIEGLGWMVEDTAGGPRLIPRGR